MTNSCSQSCNKMAFAWWNFSVLFAVILLFFTQPVAAFDAGDAIALILGLVIGIMGICACLGAYARRKEGV